MGVRPFEPHSLQVEQAVLGTMLCKDVDGNVQVPLHGLKRTLSPQLCLPRRVIP